ncbi:MAG: Rho termination factor N-terminal domain-containing protein, partial [Eubacteriales bacterium]|nr:Rho termination factor N-terminal domain-containing protein [Eubacteriales bacterium]
MREKYESLSLVTLKELAKARGLRGISTLRKPELIERMLQEDEKTAKAENTNDADKTVKDAAASGAQNGYKENAVREEPPRRTREEQHVPEGRSYNNNESRNYNNSENRSYNNGDNRNNNENRSYNNEGRHYN